MSIKYLNISGEELMDYANKSIRSYVGKTFSNFFTKEDLEDLVMTTVEKAIRKADTYEPEKGTVGSWIWVIAKNAVLSEVDKQMRRRRRFTSLDDPKAADVSILDTYRGVEQPADSELLLEELEQTLFGKLPSERDRLILNWLLEGLDDGEIAERLGVSMQAVYMAIYHLRQRLKNVA